MKYRRKHGIIFVTILIGMLLTAGCGKAKESNVTVGNKVPQLDTSTETSKKKTKGSDKKQESEEKTEAILRIQQANADGLKFIKEAGADDAVLQLKSLEAFAKAADGKATKIIIPSEIQGIAGLVKSVTEVASDAE